MIEVSDITAGVLNRSHHRFVRAQSWLGDELLADDIPIAGGSEEVDRSLRVPERITLTVPRRDRGASWSPVEVDHPLAANGQRLSVQVGIGTARGDIEWLQRGWYVVQDATKGGDTVTVTATGLLTLIDEADFISPYQPNGTLGTTVRGLVEPALSAEIDAALIDRAVPAGINYDDDRLAALLSLLDAWPADAYVNADGALSVIPAPMDAALLASEPVRTLTNGTGGTLITANGSSTRDGAFNVVVARGTATDGGTVTGVAYVTGGPRAFGGDFSPLPVPYAYASPLLTTVAQCTLAAATVRERLLRSASQTFDVEIVPDPRLQVGDVVLATTDDHANMMCTIEALKLPWLPGGGSEQLTIRRLS